jgi:hypothetical protein
MRWVNKLIIHSNNNETIGQVSQYTSNNSIRGRLFGNTEITFGKEGGKKTEEEINEKMKQCHLTAVLAKLVRLGS